MLSPIRAETIKIALLTLLLGLGAMYVTRTGARNALPFDLSLRDSPGDLGILEREFTGQAMPAIVAREASTGRQELVSFDSVGVIIPVAGNTCIQKQVSDLRRAEALHEAIGEQVPIRVVLLTNDSNEEAARYKTLLIRKAVRPGFELWYADGVNSLTDAVLSEQLEPALLIQGHTIRSVFHTADRASIVGAISDLRSES